MNLATVTHNNLTGCSNLLMKLTKNLTMGIAVQSETENRGSKNLVPVLLLKRQ